MPSRPIWKRWQLVAAAIVYVVDAWVIGQGGLAMLALLAAIVLGVVSIVRGVSGERRRIAEGFATMGVFLGVLLAVLATVIQHQAMSERRAPAVIEALAKYRDKHGTWPAKLDDLAPAFVPSVPRARYTLLYGRFEYQFRKADTPLLMFHAVPPMGRRVFDLSSMVPKHEGHDHKH